jgi:demethylspheroidene O-methyltransferase
LFSLIRVLHDHDDEPVRQLLERLHSALRPGGHLLIAEPMAGTAGAESIGDTYFSFYLWAMGSGRPRTAQELEAMCLTAGFARVSEFRTPIPALTRVLVAQKSSL